MKDDRLYLHHIGVDLDEVWNVAFSQIPELQAALEQFLAAEDPGRAGSMPSHAGTR